MEIRGELCIFHVLQQSHKLLRRLFYDGDLEQEANGESSTNTMAHLKSKSQGRWYTDREGEVYKENKSPSFQ